MDATVYGCMNDELRKIGGLEKDAIFETVRVGGKALKGALLGGTKLTAQPGVFQAEREAAVNAGNALMNSLKKRGINIHRARVKSPGSIQAKGLTSVPNDLLGMQLYGHGPEAVPQALEVLKAHGVADISHKPITRPGYHGVNVKGTYQGTPMELQISPSRMSNIGQQMEHSLMYKPQTEAPYSNFVDRWFGKNVAPKMVQSGSWVPQVPTPVVAPPLQLRRPSLPLPNPSVAPPLQAAA
jgi:hypothetical protein